ncbi:hypothetical protein B0P06_003905 [Clostridium saccharoperbutylacetonicum]|uniref:Uncharacterized protein n=1 Tax=Clostridium saccharoperbutylacetonicum N1-4(HMT) TaxID=931276 RepID=M1MIQ4_9CLOT|nr:hypothetical protein [Clostridium saccharoperbutylacetonicum]AGF57789.1 hypothetical protein Cspa_c40320 [Clostridium saccharoperbutylacetonicum N1-4(HMT)]NRT61442.1 hypothetical protein [Clostridium saccharoperbutylacetonicum]NSB24762.1 hypothetical protein [Clostridium saccharoperbutylacetonicum]NSB44134.1 hypothetical protein [Clostridium saccharoperbutylacetonicum]
MNKIIYFNKIVIITMIVALLEGCGEKTQQVETSPSNQNTASEDKFSSNTDKKEEIKAVETTKQDFKEINIDANLKKKLDTFFSNFSEAHLKSFEKDKLDDSSLIVFGIRHIMLNNFKLIQLKGDTGYVKAEDVDAKALFYFGKKVNQHKNTGEYIFENGLYKIRMASGDEYTFSQINKLYDLGNNKYKAEVSVYIASSGYTGDSHGTIEEWKASGGEIPKLSNKVTATIEKISQDGNERFILTEYNIN